MLQLPKPGYFYRMRTYLAEMYPIPTRILVSSLLYAGIVTFMRSAQHVHTRINPLFTFVGIWSLFAVMLMIRLMDELKDKDIDCRLFGSRPLPSGRVREADITFSLMVVILLYLGANLWAGPAFWMALFVFGFSMLMFKHFFMPHILRENLLLTLATHNLFVPIVYLYVLILFSVENGLGMKSFQWPSALLMIAMYWAMSFAWEIARKIRCPEEETAYVTYSQIFGPIGAVLVAGGAQTLSFAIGLYFYWAFSLSFVFLSILTTGYAITVWGYVRFMVSPSPVTSRLRPTAEAFIVCVLIAQTIEHGLLR